MFWKQQGEVGIHIPKEKEQTKTKEIIQAKVPEQVRIPMGMHIGAPAKPTVSVGDTVNIGTRIGEMDEGISTNIHATVSGKVLAIEKQETFRGEQVCIVIENDQKYTEETLPDITKTMDAENFSARLEDAGITGKGGAGFPTAVKYKLDAKEVGYLVVNGAECEPYATTDYRIMMEYAPEIVQMMHTLDDIYGLKASYIAVEDHMDDVVRALQTAIRDSGYTDIEVAILPSTYPQGHAGLQIREVLGIELETGQRSGDIGVLQSNVSTIKAMYDAIFMGKPFTKRVVTVTGPKVEQPQNLKVPFGVSVEALLTQCGAKTDDATLINGGPMMGKAFTNTAIPVDKDTTAILVLPERELPERTPCIRCAKCIDHCPVNLQPIAISNAFENGDYDLAKALKSEICIQCGTCTYVCPARIPLLENIQKMNDKWEEMTNENDD